MATVRSQAELTLTTPSHLYQYRPTPVDRAQFKEHAVWHSLIAPGHWIGIVLGGELAVNQDRWDKHRQTIIYLFPQEPGQPGDRQAYLAKVDDIHVNDAYHSLSIEGYSVTEELIERVRQASFDPFGNPEHQKDIDALAARGYWQAFQAVRASIEKIVTGEPPGLVASRDHDSWYEELFWPSVTAGILKAGALAGYRNHPVYLRGSRHTLPRAEAISDGMAALFHRLHHEESAASVHGSIASFAELIADRLAWSGELAREARSSS